MESSIFSQLRVIYLFCLFCDEKAERVHELNEEIGKMLARAEQLGGEGNVDEAQKVLENVEKSRALKKDAEVSVFCELFLPMSSTKPII